MLLTLYTYIKHYCIIKYIVSNIYIEHIPIEILAYSSQGIFKGEFLLFRQTL